MTIHLDSAYALYSSIICFTILLFTLYIYFKDKYMGTVLSAIPLFFGFLLIPSFHMDHLKITEEGVTHHTGVWFAQRVYGFKYHEISVIEIRLDYDVGLRLKEFWYITSKSGETERVDPGDLWEDNGELISKECRKHQISVSNYNTKRPTP